MKDDDLIESLMLFMCSVTPHAKQGHTVYSLDQRQFHFCNLEKMTDMNMIKLCGYGIYCGEEKAESS